MFAPSPRLSDEINHNIAQSEIDGGVYLKNVPKGRTVHIPTRNTLYSLERREDGFYLSGHPRICPEPTKVNIAGSTWGGSMLKIRFIGRGMCMEFNLTDSGGYYTTTPISNIVEAADGKTTNLPA